MPHENDRRRFLADAIRLGLTAATAAALAGCNSARTRTRSQVGQPLPPDPRIRPTLGVTSGAVSDLPSGVIGRTSWARHGPNTALADPMTSIQYITVHHDGMSPFHDASQTAAAHRLESIRRGHVGRGWADIGYHYAIDPAGRVHQARPIYLQGAHVKDHNAGNLGILVMGNFERQHPTPAALASLEAFIAQEMRRRRVRPGNVFTHQEWASTACPGRHLQAQMDRLRSNGALA